MTLGQIEAELAQRIERLRKAAEPPASKMSRAKAMSRAAELAQLLGWIRKPREGDAEDLI